MIISPTMKAFLRPILFKYLPMKGLNIRAETSKELYHIIKSFPYLMMKAIIKCERLL